MSRPSARAWVAIFVCAWCGNQFSPLLVMYEERQHYSSLMANVFLGVYVLGLTPALLIGGSLSDRHGRKPLTLAAVCAAMAGSVLLACGPAGPALLIIGRLLSGIAVGLAMAVGTTWVTELSRPPHDTNATPSSGARRASLAFILGSALGALVGGVAAQWGPAPETTPFLLHIAVAIPAIIMLVTVPETQEPGHGVPGPWWRQLKIPSASHRRFVRVVVAFAPWLFAAAALGYGYLPTQLRHVTGSFGLVFATAATVLTLTASAVIQPLAKKVHSLESARGIVVSLLLLIAGIMVVAVSIATQSIWIGLISSVIIGAGLGIGLVSALLEVQRIATAQDLAALTGLFYTLAYAGFLMPAIIAALAQTLPLQTILWSASILALLSWTAVVIASRKHLPRT